jgi:hypothetical protein
VTYTGGVVTKNTFTENTSSPSSPGTLGLLLLLFCSDYTIRLVAKATPDYPTYYPPYPPDPQPTPSMPYDQFGLPFGALSSSGLFACTGLSFLTKAPTDPILTPPLEFVTVGPGEVAKGYVGSVWCSGFATLATVSTLGISNETDNVVNPLSFNVTVDAIANGAVLSGPITYLEPGPGGEGVQSASMPVILRATDYTQAIRDANNTFVGTLGSVPVTCQVVGLWFQPST